MAQSMRRLVLAAVLAVVVLLFTVPVQHALAALTLEQTAATLAFLQGFPSALPGLSWTGTDYCSWAGVTCDATTGYVSVDLSSQGLAGAMPSFPEDVDGTLVMVTAVSLANNGGIAGNFKDDWAALKNLRSLDLSNTALGGAIPDAWNGMTALQTVKVSGTNACKGLPNWNIASLTSADLSNNKMGGALASSWAGMTLLTSVTLTGNSFCGCIPSEWTSALLVNAATAANSALASPTCGATNYCTGASYVCPTVTDPATTTPPTTAPPEQPASSSSSSSSPTTDASEPSSLPTPPSATSPATLAFLQGFPSALPGLSWTGTDYCSWEGVTCDATTGYVSVDLSSQGLAGAMPSFPEDVDGTLVMVTAVSLANNGGIAGNFKDDWAALKNLRSLDLSGTALGGAIPDAWNGMTALQTVKVSGTNACKGLPNWNIASLTSADLSNNRMGGALASSWAGMTLLTSVTLTGNSFCGCIPSEWTSALLVNAATAANSALASPTCGATNYCTGASYVCPTVTDPATTTPPTTAPPEQPASSSSSSSSPTTDASEPSSLPTPPSATSPATLAFLQGFPSALPGLSWTGTDYCSWEGVTCDATTGYVSVDLSSQGLAGAMPSFPEDVDGTLVMVTAVSLANNGGIAGNFKDDWAALKNLRSLDLSGTALGGAIPDAWNGMTALQTVKVSGTNACKGLPNWNIASLTSADLSNNKMGGALASSWAGMTLLTSVTLTGNSFCGCIPSEWTSALLVNAATAANSALASPTCGATNYCTGASYVCPTVTDPATTTPPTTAPPEQPASSSSSSSSPTTDASEPSSLPTPPSATSPATFLFLREFAYAIPDLYARWTGTDYCSWEGVTCDATTGHVSLNLSGKGLTGRMPRLDYSIDGAQVLITSIDMSDNPDWSDGFQSSWSRLTNLQHLDLSRTALKGNIPDAWTGMSSLQTVRIRSTYACKSLPAWSIASLTAIDLSDNAFSGSLPAAWGSMTALVAVNLTGVHPCGCVPSTWTSAALTSAAAAIASGVSGADCATTNTCENSNSNHCLDYRAATSALSLSQRHTLAFLQEFPRDIRYLQSRWTGVDYCGWEGVTCDAATGDVSIDLAGKGITGNMPQINSDVDGWHVMVSAIDMSNNPSWSEEFESDWGKLKRLRFLNLSHTALHDDIPDDWTAMRALEEVYITNTDACKSLPTWNIPTLRVVDFSNNNLQGSLASSWAAMPNLASVDISGNAFCGCVPSTWTSDVLASAAAGAGEAVQSATCATDNACTLAQLWCKSSGGGQPTNAPTAAPDSSGAAPVTNAATLAFLQKFANDIRYLQSRWTGTDYCSWEGVTCDATTGHVSLNLSGKGLTGRMPQLDNRIDGAQVLITSIDMSDNPDWSDGFQSSWSRLTNLQHLDLSRTALKGNIPDAWTGMSSLQTVRIRSTYACKSLPAWSIASLTAIDLSDNAFSGSLPAAWGSMTALVSVNLTGVHPCGCVPSTWTSAALTSAAAAIASGVSGADCATTNTCENSNSNHCLDYRAATSALSLSQRHTLAFLQEFPRDIRYLQSRWTGVDYCGWEGVTCDAATGDVSIDLAGKGITGNMPQINSDVDGWHVMVSAIDMSNNPSWSEEFESDWGKLKRLRFLNLSHTALHDDIPDDWTAMRALEEVYITNTDACKSLPTWNIPTLRVVDFSNNNLQGSLASSWAAMPNLASVDISGNAFCGCVPSTWTSDVLASAAAGAGEAVQSATCATDNACTLAQLWCKSSGGGQPTNAPTAAPDSSGAAPVTNAATLAFLQKFANDIRYLQSRWTGTDYCSWEGVTCDATTGHVSLNLSGKGLTGNMPQLDNRIDGAQVLITSIDMSDNPDWSDGFQSSWSRLTNLQHLDLSRTALKGNIPDAWTGMSSLQTVRIRSTYACKSLPAWSIASLTAIDLSDNAFSGSLPAAWGSMTALVSVNLTGVHPCGCVPSTWTSAALTSAAAAIASGVSGADCATTNTCENSNSNHCLDYRAATSALSLSQRHTLAFLQEFPRDIRYLQSRWTGVDYCGWEGVTCDAATGDVSIDLAGKGITGNMPQINSDVDGWHVMVSAIDMSNNPSWSEEFESDWGKLKRLRFLNLSHTALHDDIPDDWTAMRALEEVYITNTDACKSLPTWNIPTLRVVDFSNNNLQGSLASSWAAMPNLASVDISGNAFCGCVPSTWTSDVLASAAAGAGEAVQSATCATDNACTLAQLWCKSSGGGQPTNAPTAAPDSSGAAPVTNAATLAFLQKFANDIRYLQSRWTGTDYCSWEGVTCDATTGHVSLNLSGKGLTGNMPQLDNRIDGAQVLITSIDMSDNPDWSDGFQSSWSRLTNLQHLDLSRTALKGNIPDAWTGMSSLQTVRIRSTYACKSLPAWSIASLTAIDLSDNAFSGSLPAAWGSMTALVSVNLTGVHPCGCVPSTWTSAALTSAAAAIASGVSGADCATTNTCENSNSNHCLDYRAATSALSLSQRHTLAFLQEFPRDIRYLQSRWTGVDYCGWEGVTCDAATGDVSIDLAGKGITGNMPQINSDVDGWHVMVSAIDMSNNPSWSEEFESDWGKLKRLRFLNLSHTALHDDIPDDWTAMRALEEVYITNTDACKSLPTWNIPTLRVVDFSNNNLQGSLASSWAAMPNLASVDISGNAFCGCVPSTWTSDVLASAAAGAGEAVQSATCATDNACTLAQLWCKSSGGGQPTNAPTAAPDSSGAAPVTNAATLAFLQKFANDIRYLQSRWTGTDYCSWEGVTCDATTGHVSLNLSGKGLTGNMPQLDNRIDGAQVLITSIDMSDNPDWSDGFQSSWSRLTNLQHLDLSRTALKGNIPDAWTGMSSLQTVRIRSTYACKSLPAWSIASLTAIDLSDNAFSGSLPAAWGSMTALVSVNLTGVHPCGCVPSTWTSAALTSAAAAIASGVSGADCATTNTCENSNSNHCLDYRAATSALSLSQRHTLAFLQEFPRDIRYLQSRWTGVDYCGWEGVTCDAATGDVSIDLAGKGITGNMPQINSDVDGWHVMVSAIDMSNNPSWSEEFESDWGKLKRLRFLNLSHTALHDDIPDDWTAMRALEEVYITNTDACKSLPTWNIPTLRVVDFSNNNLQGSLASSWAAMPNLASVDISGNAFCGCVPSTWTSDVLASAAAGAGEAVQSATCATDNACTLAQLWCKSSGGGQPTNAPTAAPDSSGAAPVTNAATLAFLQKFANDIRYLQSRWTGTDYCSWEGVTCDATTGHVSLNLSGKGLTGNMPQLDNRIDGAQVLITSIDMSDNPDWSDGFQSSWSRLTNLQHLDLSRTALKGNIPDAWTGMSSLQTVRIRSTYACKSLPAWSIASLTAIDLSDNAFSGSLPAAWGSMTALVSVNLTGVHPCGCVPSTWTSAALTSAAAAIASGVSGADCATTNTCENSNSNHCLDYRAATSALSLSQRHTLAFLQEFPRDIRYLQSRWTGVDYCGWEGVTCDAATGDVSIDLAGKGITGNMPQINSDVDGWHVMVSAIDMSNNPSWSEEFESDWGKLKRLRFLNLSHTALHDDIPDDWTAMRALEEVYITNTDACKSLPTWNIPTLRVVDFSNNNLQGSLASSWAAMPNLASVDISGNAFCGCVPSTWTSDVLASAAAGAGEAVQSATCATDNACTLAQLWCKSSGGGQPTNAPTAAPDSSGAAPVTNAATLAFLQKFANDIRYLQSRWTGTDYCSWEGVTCDATTGHVSLNLSGKGLTGNMPQLDNRIDGAQVLITSIDMSDNPDWSDGFQSSWSRLTNLQHLDLSRTALKGNIPDAWTGMSSLQTVRIRSTYACKSLPAWSIASLTAIDLSDNAFSGSLPAAWGSMTALVSVNLTGVHPCGCVPSTWTSAALTSAAAAIASGVSGADCATTNTCENSNSNHCLDYRAATSALSLSQRHTLAFLQEFPRDIRYLQSRWTGVDYCGWEGVTCDAATGDVSIDLAGKGITGNMPQINSDVDGWHVMVSAIDMSNNPSWSEEFESDWGKLKRLRFLNLSHTALHDDIPDDWTAMRALEEVYITNTDACKSLPTWNIPTLRVVDFSNNNLQGSLASSWAAMPNLASVDISGNAFCGCVPSTWTSDVLASAAAGAGEAVQSATCATDNACTRDKLRCNHGNHNNHQHH